jgi:hypothetical protein
MLTEFGVSAYYAKDSQSGGAGSPGIGFGQGYASKPRVVGKATEFFSEIAYATLLAVKDCPTVKFNAVSQHNYKCVADACDSMPARRVFPRTFTTWIPSFIVVDDMFVGTTSPASAMGTALHALCSEVGPTPVWLRVLLSGLLRPGRVLRVSSRQVLSGAASAIFRVTSKPTSGFTVILVISGGGEEDTLAVSLFRHNPTGLCNLPSMQEMIEDDIDHEALKNTLVRDATRQMVWTTLQTHKLKPGQCVAFRHRQFFMITPSSCATSAVLVLNLE